MILANSSCLSLVYDLQPTKKCASSSMMSHNEQRGFGFNIQTRQRTHKVYSIPHPHGITVTSWWAHWRLKSLAFGLSTQPFAQAQIKVNIKAPRQWPWCWHSMVTSNAENGFICWRHHGIIMGCLLWLFGRLKIVLCSTLYRWLSVRLQ